MSNFNEELFGCLSDIKVCLLGWCFACCLQAVAVDKATGTGAIVPALLTCCLGCIGAAINRGKIRERFGIEGSFVTDCLIWWCCGPCAACQEYREVQRRG
jgi:Cys-rich protein (TIGR01571 family)